MGWGWEDLDISWAEVEIAEQNAPGLIIFGKDTREGFEDYTATTYFNQVQNPLWISRQSLDKATGLIETHYFEIQYRASADAQIALNTTDVDGNAGLQTAFTLPSTSGARKVIRVYTHGMLGMGSTMQVIFSSGICAIERIRRVTMEAGSAGTVIQGT